MTYQLTLIQNPAKTFSFVGSVPAVLGYVAKDGSELTNAELAQVARASNPAMLAKPRVFQTADDARRFARKLGFTFADITK